MNAYIAKFGVHIDPNAGHWAGGIGAETFASKEECIAYWCNDAWILEFIATNDELYGSRDAYAVSLCYEWYNGHWVMELADGKYYP